MLRKPLLALLPLLACSPALVAQVATDASEVSAPDLREPGGAEEAPDDVALLRAAAVERVIELGRTDNRVQEHLDYLVNRIGPRLTSSSNYDRAAAWARRQFEQWGLEARLERWGDFPVGFDRHAWSGRMLLPEERQLEFITPAWTPGTPGPVRGPAVLRPRTLEELEAAGDGLRGAWVVQRPRDDRGTREEQRAVGERLEAAGIAGEVRSSWGKGLVHTSGNHRVEWDDLPARVSIRLRSDQFQGVQDRLLAGQPVELEFDVDNRFRRGPIPQHNVIADIPGSELPDEYVIVGGHLDSWDGATGTCDNGTGVATTMEAARLLMESGARPRRTIRFALWGGEEQGLFGSRGYVRDHADELERISAVLIHDGGTNFLAGLEGPRALVDDLRAAFAPVRELDPEKPFRVKLNEGLSPRGSSDHAPFVAAGVPGFFWKQDGRADYDRVHHTQHDHFEEAIAEYQQHSAIVVAVGALNLANQDGLLDRTGLVRAEQPRRRMGVMLEETEIVEVIEGGKAEQAGWQAGDRILSIDGVDVADRGEVVRELHEGDPLKTIRLRRGDEEFESVLDYSAGEPRPADEEHGGGERTESAAGAGDGEEAPQEAEPQEAGSGGRR